MPKKVMELEADFLIDENEIEFSIDDNEVAFDLEEQLTVGGTQDYRKLKNLPKINGTRLVENYNEIDPTVPAWAKMPDKPAYDAEEVGAVDEDKYITNFEIDVLMAQIFK